MFRSPRMCIASLAILLGLGLLIACIIGLSAEPKGSAAPSDTTVSTSSTNSTAATQPTVSTPPAVVKEKTVTIGATGDILLHKNVIRSGYDKATDSYDFSHIFQYLASYVGAYDYAVGNMEGTLAGDKDGYDYSGYPQFNAPDAIVTAAKDAGFDMLLTANNHSYDTQSHGFHRTQQVIASAGLDYTGTRTDAAAKNYLIKDVQGIKIAMSCYTYDTRQDTSGRISLNGITLSAEDALRINTFNKNHLDEFYGRLEQEISAMRAEGADAVMLFIHWGDEYHTTPNKTQKAIAQKLCDLGVDVIVGGHPHVIQPMEMLTGSEDAAKSTLCLYSLGNAVSNIRKGPSYPGETEDGILFSVSFAKYSDGTVLLERADVLPYYVNRYRDAETGLYRYPLIPLELPQDQWKSAFQLTDDMVELCQASLKRTQAVLGDTLQEANAFLAQQQAQTEQALGVQN